MPIQGYIINEQVNVKVRLQFAIILFNFIIISHER
jgi:hypothetical protein